MAANPSFYNFPTAYFVIGDHNPTTDVWAVANGGYVSNTDAAYVSWLANLWGNITSATIVGAADNGAGLIRLTIAYADQSVMKIATGDRMTVGNVVGTTEANSNWLCTVIDESDYQHTTIDLQGSAFSNAYVSGGFIASGPARASAGIMEDEVAATARDQYRDGYVSYNQGTDITLVNLPTIGPANVIDARITTSGKFVHLSQMNLPNSLPLGQPQVIRNDATTVAGNAFGVKDFVGNVIIPVLSPGEEISIRNTSFASPEGILKYSIGSTGQFPALVNRGGTGLTSSFMSAGTTFTYDPSSASYALFPIAGNSTTDTALYSQTGDGVNSANPNWGIKVSSDVTLGGGSPSTTKVPNEVAVKAYADALIAANDAMVFKGVIDCSTNPNYPAADRGHTYRVSVAGKIGGASGNSVDAGDILICLTDGTASGTQAAVGAQWTAIETNIADLAGQLAAKAPLASPALTGTPTAPTAAPGTNTTQLSTTAFVKAAIDVVLGGVSAAFDTLSEIATDLGLKMVKSANLSDVASVATARTNLGLGASFQNVVLQIFTASGPYTPTAGMVKCIIECVAGGGGGGGTTGSVGWNLGGGGGGGGGYSKALKTAAQVGASQTVTIGAGGTGTSNANGGAGGDTSVGTLCIAKGGSGGVWHDVGTSFGAGGAGGIAGTGDFTIPGQVGDDGWRANNTVVNGFGASGGSSHYGPGGGKQYNTGNNGNAGKNYGGGGGGSYESNVTTSHAGGVGIAGVVIITEFIGP